MHNASLLIINLVACLDAHAVYVMCMCVCVAGDNPVSPDLRIGRSEIAWARYGAVAARDGTG